MATAIGGNSRIRTNIPALNAYDSLIRASAEIATSQLRISTGKRINSAADDVAGYITSKALKARNSGLQVALRAADEAKNVTAITMDSLDQVSSLLSQIKDAAAQASAGALGTDEKVALAKAGYRLAQQIQFITDSTVFGGRQLLQGDFKGDWITAYDAQNNPMSISLNLKTDNLSEFNIQNAGNDGFNLNATSQSKATGSATISFAGVNNFNLEDLNNVTADNLGIFASGDNITTTLKSLSLAINNINKVASYVGGIHVRFDSQTAILQSQITNYKAAISRIEDADIATEQMNLIKAQFLQSASLYSLAQANQNPSQFLQLLG